MSMNTSAQLGHAIGTASINQRHLVGVARIVGTRILIRLVILISAVAIAGVPIVRDAHAVATARAGGRGFGPPVRNDADLFGTLTTTYQGGSGTGSTGSVTWSFFTGPTTFGGNITAEGLATDVGNPNFLAETYGEALAATFDPLRELPPTTFTLTDPMEVDVTLTADLSFSESNRDLSSRAWAFFSLLRDGSFSDIVLQKSYRISSGQSGTLSETHRDRAVLPPGNYSVAFEAAAEADGFVLISTAEARADASLNIQLNPTDFPQIISNAIDDFPDGGAMFARFSPNRGLTLFEAAEEGGFDHFNWYQEIDNVIPATPCVTPVCSLALNLIRGQVPRVDPLVGGNPGDVADAFAWYWDEQFVPGRSGYLWQDNLASGDRILEFSDEPNLLVPGLRVEFTTYLAGIEEGPDHRGVVFRSGPGGNGYSGTAFRWAYTEGLTQAGDSVDDVTILQNIDPARAGNGTVEFLGFLQPEDWDEQRIARLEEAGIFVAFASLDIEHLTGDFNGNGAVEQADLDLVLLHWGEDGVTPPSGWVHDIPTGTVDQNELDAVLLAWGQSISNARYTAVPEPSAILLAPFLVAMFSQRVGAQIIWITRAYWPAIDSHSAERLPSE